ncbi:hypothetical protein, partial [Paracidovorax valerianellae]
MKRSEIKDEFLKNFLIDIENNYFPTKKQEAHNQASENIFFISIKERDRARIRPDEMKCFISSIKTIISKKIEEASTIYFWIDGYAGQLRFSVIKQALASTSFKCKTQAVQTEKIVEGYLVRPEQSRFQLQAD